MSANNSGGDGGQDKAVPETTLQTIPQNLTTIQNIQTVQSIQTIQSVQNVASSGIPSIQTTQTVMAQAGTLVGKSISLELNPKLIMKPSIPSSIGSASENNKITTGTVCTFLKYWLLCLLCGECLITWNYFADLSCWFDGSHNCTKYAEYNRTPGTDSSSTRSSANSANCDEHSIDLPCTSWACSCSQYFHAKSHSGNSSCQSNKCWTANSYF